MNEASKAPKGVGSGEGVSMGSEEGIPSTVGVGFEDGLCPSPRHFIKFTLNVLILQHFVRITIV